ncbi:hypothetical protein C0993_007326, partial [Termitomyces sp. T159_Od127]
MVLSAEEVAEIRTSHAQLQALISQLLAKVDVPPALSPAPTLLTLPVPQAMGPFVPSITTIGVNTLAAIITHEFKAADLHKLNLMNGDKETAYTFNRLTNQFELSYYAVREYKTPFS